MMGQPDPSLIPAIAFAIIAVMWLGGVGLAIYFKQKTNRDRSADAERAVNGWDYTDVIHGDDRDRAI